MDEKCSSCRFSRKGDYYLECHKHAPAVRVPYASPKQDYGGSVHRADWPEVEDADWCGEYSDSAGFGTR
jgi:hypothetical protein